MNGARFCIQICKNDGLTLDLHCRQKNFLFENVAFSQFLTLEMAYSEKLRHIHLFTVVESVSIESKNRRASVADK